MRLGVTKDFFRDVVSHTPFLFHFFVNYLREYRNNNNFYKEKIQG